MKIHKLILVFAIFIIAFALPVSAQTFSDVNEGAWYYDVVEAGVNHGYVGGYNDGTFKPNSTVTNAEFYKMIAVAFGIEVPEMEATHWAAPYARALYMDGNKNIETYPGYFNMEINRKDAIRNLVFAAGDIHSAIPSKYFDIETFKDMPISTIWDYDGYILIAQINGVINGDENGFVNPDKTLTRAEAVTLIERALAVDEWEIREPDVLKGLEVQYIGKYSNTFKESLCSALDKFSRELVEKFIADGGKIIVTDEDYEKYYGQRITTDISGLYQSHNKTIVLFTNGRAASLFFDVTGTLVHEFGHYLYYEILNTVDKNNINRIFKEGIEPAKLAEATNDNYCLKDVDEYWAELVSYQVSSKMWGRADIPESLAILEKYVNEYDYSK